MNDSLREELAVLLGERAEEARSVGGGSIANSYCVTLRGGERCFVKCYDGAAERIARCEARGLQWLNDANALGVARFSGSDVVIESDVQVLPQVAKLRRNIVGVFLGCLPGLFGRLFHFLAVFVGAG